MKKDRIYDFRSKGSDESAIINLAILKRLATIAKEQLERRSFGDIKQDLSVKIEFASSKEELVNICTEFIEIDSVIALICSEDLRESGLELIDYPVEQEM